MHGGVARLAARPIGSAAPAQLIAGSRPTPRPDSRRRRTEGTALKCCTRARPGARGARDAGKADSTEGKARQAGRGREASEGGLETEGSRRNDDYHRAQGSLAARARAGRRPATAVGLGVRRVAVAAVVACGAGGQGFGVSERAGERAGAANRARDGPHEGARGII